ncbi:MAG: Sec-independent protein translocase subunit TatA [Actinomycetales bacterium]|jgi:sec-independent protein translocase protein TatA|nr:Sec-independent protein translocase subunit TatA [Leifsonia sp.]
MFGNLTGWHLLLILAVVLLLFGAPKLPGLAKSIGQSMRIFKGEVDEMKKDGTKPAEGTTPADGTQNSTTPAPVASPSEPQTPSSGSSPKP